MTNPSGPEPFPPRDQTEDARREQPDLPRQPAGPAPGEPNPADISQPGSTLPTTGTNPAIPRPDEETEEEMPSMRAPGQRVRQPGEGVTGQPQFETEEQRQRRERGEGEPSAGDELRARMRGEGEPGTIEEERERERERRERERNR